MRRLTFTVLVAASIMVASPASARTVVGTNHHDHLDGRSTNDVLRGMAGDDLIHAMPGNDKVYGGPGKDAIYGGPGRDEMWGGDDGRPDHISANQGNDIIHARGSDYVDAGHGRDHVYVTHANKRNEIHCAEDYDVLTFIGPRNGARVISCEKIVYKKG
jgi:Ca2+-binding RTX toxin-like protein